MPSKKTPPGKSPAKKSRMPAITDSAAEFEALLKRAGKKEERYALRLYVTGNTVRSAQAIANIRSLCEEYLPGRYDLEVVDIYQQPAALAQDQIVAAPTLVKTLPQPVKRVVGDLSNRDKVIIGLDLAPKGGRTGQVDVHWMKL